MPPSLGFSFVLANETLVTFQPVIVLGKWSIITDHLV